MRLFVASDIPDEIRQRITRFVEGLQQYAPDANWVKPASYHVTLKFIGEKSPADVEQLETYPCRDQQSAGKHRLSRLRFLP